MTTETPTAISNPDEVAPLAPRSRSRVQECMRGMLVEGDVQLFPAFVLCVYQHIAQRPAGASDEAFARQCVYRASEILSDLASLVSATQHRAALEDRRVAREAAPQIVVHASLFALGAALHIEALRPTVAWCAAYFFVLRSYEATRGVSRVLLSPNEWEQVLERIKWILAMLFFLLDAPSPNRTEMRSRLFAGFATGVLLHRVLFLREARVTKLLHCFVGGFDAAYTSLLSYTLLALRLLCTPTGAPTTPFVEK